MAGVDLGGGGKKGHKKGKKQKKRISIRIDMTPMVDVIMLLLTFFMLTTVFSSPQTMEINIPPESDVKVDVPESYLLTLRVTADGTIYYNIGIEMPKVVAFNDLHKLLVESLQKTPKLICLLKVNREATYDAMVNIMDEINLAGVTRFSLAPFTDADQRVIQKVRGV
jgi:biopolymer transport protein ExbD